MAAKKPPPSIEQRILAALKVAGGPRTVSQLHGPGMPGLTSRRASEIEGACERMVGRRELEIGVRVQWGRHAHYITTYSLATGN